MKHSLKLLMILGLAYLGGVFEIQGAAVAAVSQSSGVAAVRPLSSVVASAPVAGAVDNVNVGWRIDRGDGTYNQYEISVRPDVVSTVKGVSAFMQSSMDMHIATIKQLQSKLTERDKELDELESRYYKLLDNYNAINKKVRKGDPQLMLDIMRTCLNRQLNQHGRTLLITGGVIATTTLAVVYRDRLKELGKRLFNGIQSLLG